MSEAGVTERELSSTRRLNDNQRVEDNSRSVTVPTIGTFF